MNDTAQSLMSNGEAYATAYVSSVNDNMSQSHYHDYYELYFLDNGERYHYYDNHLFKTLSGECIIFPPQTMHRSYSNKDSEFSRVVIYFRPEILVSDELKEAALASMCVYKPNKEAVKQLRRLIYILLETQNQNSGFKKEQMISLINLILSTVLSSQTNQTDYVQKSRTAQVINYIVNNYEHDISLADLSKRFHVSEYYLCREFKKNTNRTIVDYIKHTRIMNAERLFAETDLNVTEVAGLTGFSNLTHFNRVFKEINGLTPSQYRKTVKFSET